MDLVMHVRKEGEEMSLPVCVCPSLITAASMTIDTNIVC